MRFSLVLMLSLLHPGSRAVAQRTAPPACTETADHATATVLQQWYRTQDMAGAARRVGAVSGLARLTSAVPRSRPARTQGVTESENAVDSLVSAMDVTVMIVLLM